MTKHTRTLTPALLGALVLSSGALAQTDALKQWASGVVTRSSEYSQDGWAARQALGEPNTMAYGDNSSAWAPASKNGVVQSITVSFTTPVHASAVLVRETYGNGFVRKIFAIDTRGGVHQVWAGRDTAQPNYTVNFIARFPSTPYLVKSVKVVIDPDHNPDAYEEIDAVQLHGIPTP